MKKFVLISIVLVILLLRTTSHAQTDERWFNGVSEPWWFGSQVYTKEEASVARLIWEQIGEEKIVTQNNEWVGTYIVATAELHTSYLRWSPQLGYVSMGIYSCEARVTNLNYGTVVFSPALFQLAPKVPIRSSKSKSGHGSHGPQFLPAKYLPVKWGERHYLIPEKSVAAFYGYVSGLGDSGGDFFVKLADYDKSVEGMPILPPGYERFVRKPVEATVRAVGAKVLKRSRNFDGSPAYDFINHVTINAGSANGIRRGMRLFVVGSKERETVEITRVGKYSSRGVIDRLVDDNMKENRWNHDARDWEAYPDIRVGWQLTTSWYLSRQ
jgi:hypothetical protein